MKILDNNKAIVIFSGGQDSTTILAWAVDKWTSGNVKTITFDYGQRHHTEIDAAVEISNHFDVQNYLIDADIIEKLSSSALLSADVDISEFVDGLPASFVPGRNLFFITTTAMLAYKLNIKNIVIGVCQTDYSGYPDCREITIECIQKTIDYGMDTFFNIHTPLMHLTKAQTFELADDLNILELVLNKTSTCYFGDQSINVWGKGCGKCPACKLRKKGWHEYSR